MAVTRIGAQKIAAKKAGISLEMYLNYVDSGLKKCTKCKLWKRIIEFPKDRSRHDGLKASCRACQYQRTRPISLGEHKAKKAAGLAWCTNCQMWHPSDEIRGSRCLQHRRQYNRDLYAKNEQFRYKRRQKTSIRRRGVDAVPPIGEAVLLEDFRGRCAYCQRPATTYDHIIPVSQGGRTTRGNIVPACRSCNASKGTKDVHAWMEEKGIPYPQPLMDVLALADYWSY